ncbi:DUF3231 family protein [Pelotomaculum isophthalicicum JI]|uniref:DUF3231 family protein n=1 Tax=Pelotomaculum isophthalicicum JI TaxID=947010 RepID=A0A9X4H623_9FIRM|nr:DUF3231 family protein [Pelotomaculum isophthalicicum]MDF9408867.1 DUF3231 family protein [Pelotomaculum isophthalicicum JI]
MEKPYIDESNIITEKPSFDPGLTSSEIASLWNAYLYVSMISVFIKYLSLHIQDSDIKSLAENAVQLYEQQAKDIRNIMEPDNLPIPVGFTAEDVNLEAPRLYSDLFCNYYLFCLERFIIPRNAFNLGLSTRYDVREFFNRSIVSSLGYFDNVTNTLLSKGLYIRYPNINLSETIDFVKKQNFLTGFLGEKRPSLAQEIAASFHLIFLNSVGKNLMTGFRQVTRSKQVGDYLERGIKLANKIIDTFSAHLKEDDIPVPMFWDTMVTDSVEPPVSDKLMMFHIGLINTCGAMDYSLLSTLNFRHDLKAKYLLIMAEAGDFAEDGTNIMIDNGWFEEPPRIINRKEIINKVH